MRVVEIGKLPEKEAVCQKCNSVLAYTEADVKHNCEELFGELHSRSDISCPICGQRIILSIDGTPVINGVVTEVKE